MVTVKSDKPVRTKTIICYKCGYELEYTGEDVIESIEHDYGGGSDMVYHIICPRNSCKYRNKVKQW